MQKMYTIFKLKRELKRTESVLMLALSTKASVQKVMQNCPSKNVCNPLPFATDF